MEFRDSKSKIVRKEVEEKHKELIECAKSYMTQVKDYEHNFKHIEDVLYYLDLLEGKIEEKFDYEALLIASYWHDVGRVKKENGHEEISASMLEEELIKLNYNQEFIHQCIEAIRYHGWSMNPTTIEGLILKDIDKLAWIGLGRWEECLKHHQKLASIMEKLPKLRNEILYFEESRKIYDQEILKLVEFLYESR